MDFLLTWFAVYITLSFFLDDDGALWPALVIAFILSSLEGDEDDTAKEVKLNEGTTIVVTQEKANTVAKEKATKGLPENKTRVEWHDDTTKWKYHKGQTWETTKNF